MGDHSPIIDVSMKISSSQKAIVRKKLLREAAKKFAEQGFEETNIDSIAISAGYAKGTIYNYFNSKEDLFAEVISEAAEQAVTGYRVMPAHENVRESLRELALSDVTVLKSEESFMKVLAAEAMNPRSNRFELILKHLGKFIDLISQILEKGVEKGEIRKDKPVPQLSLIFLGLLTMLYIQHWQSGGVWPSLDEIPELVVTIFMDGAKEPIISEGKEV